MKNLANCSPVEFLRQTNRIRHSVSEWIKDTKILEIRKNRAKLLPVDENAPDDKKKEIEEKNRILVREQAKKNISDMLDVALDTNAEKTLEVLALMCFVEPENMNDYKATAYLKEFGEILSDKDVIDFFTSLMRLDQMGIFEQSNQ